ncbi:uncharacterized protein LOC110835585 isoform X3 [Zootermopsis nevadensis]|uniref:uncharacterized protein LOC110835585 isoform X3 n=1 Tax=Zootermopsis nevadensis TaxID=136037 RepID=UPI000B8E8467|nr:uncharacterized protein LOC110835585 isoform X3 [Zootermopsis nevadensis]
MQTVNIIRRCLTTSHSAAVSWDILRSELVSERLSWVEKVTVVNSILSLCLKLRELLISLPDPACRELSKSAFRIVTNIIAKYNNVNRSRINNFVFRRLHYDVCLHLLSAVYLPCLEECNFKEIWSEFLQELLSQSLPLNPNIKRLILPLTLCLNVSRFVVSNLQRLILLQEFRSEFCCTTDIAIELGRHCILLKILDVTHSTFVTDGCVEYLLNLTNLEKLNITGTEISERSYALLLSRLPRIQNIHWRGAVEGILRNISVECLPLLTEFSGTVFDPSLLTRKCPGIKNLKVSLQNPNALKLVLLNDIVSLELGNCDYISSNLDILVQVNGSKLKKLHLFMVRNVNLSEIIKCCYFLKVFIITSCEVRRPKRIICPKSQHFMSVTVMALQGKNIFENIQSYLHYYINLKVFHAESIPEINDVTLSLILNLGGFRNLSEIILSSCGSLTLQTAQSLIKECVSLGVLGKVKTWLGFTDADRKKLFDFVKSNNLVLNVK